MTTYIEHINTRLREIVGKTDHLVGYGQNITAGSHLSGLTRGLKAAEGSVLLNTPNIENSLIGIGFGVMLRGQNALFLCKQQDFLLLGLDQVVNTYNAIRERCGLGSFTVAAIVVDSGFEGPQSALNNLTDFCSMAHVPGYLISNRHDADAILAKHLVAPGFRFINISQRLYRTELLEWNDADVTADANADVFRYASGRDATIVAFNLALPEATGVWRALSAAGKSASLFSVNNVWQADWSGIVADAKRTGRLVVVDDGKSANRQSDRFLRDVYMEFRPAALVNVHRSFKTEGLKPNPDQLEIDPAKIVAQLGF